MSPTVPRVAPLHPPYPAEAGAWLAKWMPPGAAHEPLVLFRTLATHPGFTDRMRGLGAGILGSSSRIAPRDRELLIARTCARCGCEYEWGVHVASLGRQEGLSPEIIRATVLTGSDDPIWDERERVLVRLVDTLHGFHSIPDGLWTDLAGHWPPEQCIELITMVGWYHLISFLANGLALPLEPWAARWPMR